MILISKNAQIKLNNVGRDTVGRFVATDLTYGESQFTLANIYAPNLDSPGFFMNRFEQIESMSNDLKIIRGDYNLTPGPLDKNGNRPHPHVAATEFIKSYM